METQCTKHQPPKTCLPFISLGRFVEIHLCTFAMCSTLCTHNGLFALHGRVCVCCAHVFVNKNDHVHFRAVPHLWLGIHAPHIYIRRNFPRRLMKTGEKLFRLVGIGLVRGTFSMNWLIFYLIFNRFAKAQRLRIT